MALSPRLEIRQGQALVMTPQLQQAIKLLQFNNIELAAYVEQEVEQNPLLEHADPEVPERGDREGMDTERVSVSPEKNNESYDELESSEPDAAQLSASDTMLESSDAPLDINYNEVLEADPEPAPMGPSVELSNSQGRSQGSAFNDDIMGLEQTLSRDISLKDHLLNQLGVDVDDPVDQIIGIHIIDTVDEAGYLSVGLEGISEIVGCSLMRVEETLKVLQRFDPPGILARNLGECLAAQLREQDRLDPAMELFLDNLDLLARHDYQGLIKVCGVDNVDILEMAAEIKSLNPKPGLLFGSEIIQPVVPDVYVRPSPDGGWQIELNSDTLPQVLVNNRYYSEVNDRAKSNKEKAYLTERLNSANWLIKSLDQRANTILRVAMELVRQQDTFLILGIEYLRPLNLRDISTAIEMHESTVSRVTANKYISTPRGIFPMKYFFTSALSSSLGGDSHSAESVRHKIKELIESERHDSILSDDKIVQILQASGIGIARRTVAKYREALRIPSSVERRRQKKAQSNL